MLESSSKKKTNMLEFENLNMQQFQMVPLILGFTTIPFMKLLWKPIVLSIIFLTASLPKMIFPQTVGLTLSGGGAKGLAHIGLIKALEENNIPIDYIAGTSMGAIVGGLYAIGYTTDEMEALLNSDEFRRWSQGIIDTDEEYYYKLKKESSDWIEFPFSNVNGEIKALLPTNLISPEQMDLRFMQFLEPAIAGAEYDFNKLMVPFFCIATDVHRNKPVTLTQGNLSSAVRASMTFPGYYKPITIDSVLLFDGGMENNFPTNLMQERFKPDVLIGCKVASNPKKPDEDNIFLQLENVFMKNTNYQMPKNGILVEPSVDEFGLFDFNQFDSLFNRGYQAAQLKMDSIKLLIHRRVPTEELNLKRENFRKQIKPFVIDNIYITGVDNQTVDYILKNIKRNRQLLTFEEFEKEYFKILSDKLVRSVYPRAQFNPNTGYFDMYLKIKTKNEFSVSVGGNISSNLRNTGFVDLDYYFQKKNIYNLYSNMFIGKFYNSITGKFRMDFPPRTIKRDRVISPFYIDLSATTNYWNYFKLSSEWFVDSESPTQISQKEVHFQSNFGRPVNTRGIFYMGFSYGELYDEYFQTNLVAKDDVADVTTFDYSSIHATYEFSTLNYKEYPNQGRFLKLQTRYVTGQEKYRPGTTPELEYQNKSESGHSWYSMLADYQSYFKANPRFTLGIRATVLYSNKSAFSNSMSTLLSAFSFTPFPQSKVMLLENYRSHGYGAFGLIPIFTFTKAIDLRIEAYLYQPYQYIYHHDFYTTYSGKFPNPIIMASAALVFHSPLGPLAATASYFTNEETPYYFQVSFGYLLFNKRGID
ncbi:MAG TPA: hypothetical protein DCQ26_20040 [Marinilabiliales bacterium]|nr:MAG: hypothetical protein A2W84_15350 [Bacteroidetes bacterium GWC2_40_13]OFX72317.1 MAG: hypothetical protein A2W96_17965 [Bacteroidetes bacterium GWD2_40_43]OFX90435.1 MAG: hypothetical protein A2W97_01435 [Bacteroidetes bacterium GWE2_40_63]OFY17319.1 MAG: hypothetical protein A2W88_15430 [Bacteroidetes bacterium GWF2_40_13]OFZ27337.1 MAG: hypothetical protein A2437_13830 [Bacteroidetes bacterium RIFOXYC2_FULL_40_12]HAN00889.1 hypothetical protein [Marinilabiliales bacterium]